MPKFRAARITGQIAEPSEHLLQVRLLKALVYMLRADVFVFAIPNQSNRHINNAMKMFAEGVRAGVADLCFLYPAVEGAVAFIEMKQPGGALSASQKTFRDYCLRAKIRWAIAFSIEEAIDALRGWNLLKPGARLI